MEREGDYIDQHSFISRLCRRGRFFIFSPLTSCPVQPPSLEMRSLVIEINPLSHIVMNRGLSFLRIPFSLC